MGFAEFTQSTGWKKFMAKLYGIGYNTGPAQA
jgi:hypothetical protein